MTRLLVLGLDQDARVRGRDGLTRGERIREAQA